MKILVIIGPTATGKTDLALILAKKFGGELISADSRQVYKGLDIGTGKMPGRELRIMNYESRIKKGKRWWEIDGIKVWMYDVVSPKVQYNVARFVKDTSKIIDKIQKKGRLPILVGGTGLYIKALIDGMPNLSIPIDRKLRSWLQKLSVSQLQDSLKQISFKKWKSINYSDSQNPRRLIRAIELVASSKFKVQNSKIQFKSQNFNILKIGLAAEREVLYQRANKSIVSRIRQGMIEEAARLQQEGLSLKRMRQLGLEYGVLADFLEKKIKTEDELVQILRFRIHGYTRRQLTWFKKEKGVNWFDITTPSYKDSIEKLVSDWYNQN